jgi:hypothetical protein
MKAKTAVLTGSLLAATFASARAEEVTYSGQIRPLFEAKCAGCHGKDAAPEYQAFKKEMEKWLDKGQGMRMDTYSHLVFFTAWPDTGALMRRLDDGKGAKEGKPGNMYQHLGATEEERQKNLALFKGWVGNWVLKKWPEVTKEEMNGITVKY